MKTMLSSAYFKFDSLLANLPEWVISLAMRLVIFRVFWLSVQTKIDGLTIAGQHFAFWNLTSNTFLLFEYEYDLPLIPPTVAAYLGTFGEYALALLLVVGLLTRFAALGLLVITLVIQFLVYPNAWWPVHVFWVLPLLYLIKHGGGAASLDRLLFKR